MQSLFVYFVYLYRQNTWILGVVCELIAEAIVRILVLSVRTGHESILPISLMPYRKNSERLQLIEFLMQLRLNHLQHSDITH